MKQLKQDRDVRIFIIAILGIAIILGITAFLAQQKRYENENYYNAAIESYNNGEFETAKNLFTQCYSFSDSIQYIVECNQSLEKPCVLCPHCREIVYLYINSECTEVVDGVAHTKTYYDVVTYDDTTEKE